MNTVIGKKIRLARLEKGYSQKNIADLLYMEQPSFCRLETGMREIRVSELEKIAVILEKPVNYFFFDNAG
ncbi:MAG: helix-turn-helix transcriptional regulator [Ferruginibacter sp.]